MSGKIIKISLDEAKEYMDNDLLLSLKRGQQGFKVKQFIQENKNDELVDLEIALRQCERVGFFRNE
ncbi:hypothetical protein KGO95_01800 [Patescibacteria group bacterium]|nr:hypothetical protein [Patescibacteria group bacterium]